MSAYRYDELSRSRKMEKKLNCVNFRLEWAGREDNERKETQMFTTEQQASSPRSS